MARFSAQKGRTIRNNTSLFPEFFAFAGFLHRGGGVYCGWADWMLHWAVKSGSILGHRLRGEE